jgi:TolB-like protein
VGQIVQTAVNDNVTPTQTREGLTDRYIAAGSVRAGAMLLQKVAPELVDGYQRYYLRSANRSSSTFTAVFALPDGMRDAISRQIDIVLGGI